jgi:alcohol-forming fatty acyl-CoA reductase
MSLDVRSGFSNRTLFMTGGTGFVGKVLLYKLLKETPDVKRVYLLMRGKRSRRLKKYLNAQERLDLEVLGSPCFEPLRQQLGDAKWRELCQKITAMEGDITFDHLGLSEQNRTTLANEANFIVHLAATVNFNERMDLAVQMNTLGGLRVLALAKTCSHLEAMVHVSTCYVNYRRHGRDQVNEERLYPLEFDPEEMCKRVLGMNEAEVKAESAKLLKSLHFPNTYTFTKCIGEQLIYKYKEHVPVVVVRPSIVGCSLRDPFPGWVDALTAAGGLLLTVSLGVVREVLVNKDMIADVIPVDHVVNVILKALFKTQQHYKDRRLRQAAVEGGAPLPNAAADTTKAALPVSAGALSVAVEGKAGGGAGNIELANAAVTSQVDGGVAEARSTEEFTTTEADEGLPFIYQVSTTGSENATTWGRVGSALCDYMRGKRHPKSLSQMSLTMTTSVPYYKLRYYALRYVPFLAIQAAFKLPPPIGSPKKQELVSKLGRAVRRADLLTWEFVDFTLHEWIYANKNARRLDDGLNEYCRKCYSFDPYAINWYAYTQVYTYGVFKHILREAGDFQLPKVPPSATEVFERASSL